MAINTLKVTREILAETLNNDRGSLIKLLKRNGIDVQDSITDKQLTVAVLTASGKSPVFRKELAKLLTDRMPKAIERFNSFAGGSDMFGFTGIDDFENVIGQVTAIDPAKLAANTPEGKSTQKKKSGLWDFLKTNVLTPENINAGINAGLTSINNKAQQKANNVQAEAVYIQQTQDALNAATPKATASNTTKYVLIGAGILVAVIAVVMIVKAKKK